MITIFDLDYTIFDADKFKRLGLSQFLGLSETEFMRYYKENFKDKKINYNIGKHMLDLGWDKEKIIKKTEEFTPWLKKEINQYLFPEAEKLLCRFKVASEKMILASFGDPEFQKQKIFALTIGGAAAENFFDEIIISDSKKSELGELKKLRGESILLVNDKIKELAELMEIFGDNCEAFLIDGPYARNPEYDFTPHSLKELEEKFFPPRPEAQEETKIKIS